MAGVYAHAEELVSIYGHDLKMVECSAKVAAAYGIVGDADQTLWQVYPELQKPIGRSHVNAVLSSGLPRTIAIEPEGRYLLLFRSELGLGVIETPIGNSHYGASDEDPERALLLHQARHDALTGLANRRQFSEDLETNLPATEGHKIALMQIDLDDFKPVNDTLGHGAGDVVLKITAERIQALLRKGESAYRLAGDEFAVIQSVNDQPAEAERLAETLVRAFKEPFTIGGINVFVGASVGIAIAPTDGNDGEQLMKAADIALYAAKNDGRGRARMFNRSMMIMLEQREMLRRSLRVALRQRQFFIEYQPIVGVAHGIVGFEALLRWRHPYAGVIPPSLFIPMAENDGLMPEIGAWVLEEACREASTWPSHCIVAVNLSPAQFLEGDFTDRISSILDEVGLPPDRLELEITETVLLERTTENLDMLHTLEVLGIRIGLDDFGTRYSSLSYLQNFPFDTIKIDRHFVKDVESNPRVQTIVRFIIGLAHGLGMQVTAEGVETAGQAEWLGKRKCDRLQGNFLGAPMSAKATGDFLKRRSVTTA
ncbi:EAL domain-containing protein [Rhizobium bangladeshense]|uniref:putative bifunctional diguanylate cyclase/phosphodiesterase n=1 Tax=Rhizobium bangladeshense TaxID=1138189 RepID=UPI001C82E980|nr:EAL domain-containing protein [Rhizobium bangladeshense]MBX4871394.1 EAL domain-containing protein [Rhizobium bangladeshense]MBX4887658.1 EAL domain-containing protein [Rhizobium bangladeshense]